jgi:hypothetical protein
MLDCAHGVCPDAGPWSVGSLVNRDSWGFVARQAQVATVFPTVAIRKHLGLLSLWFLSIHITISLLFNLAYYGKFFIDASANMSKLNAK